jgi:large subunit ribosomal protein L2
MGIKRFRPYTPSRRAMTVSDFAEITKAAPERSLVVHVKKYSGRNDQGKITVQREYCPCAI